MKFKKTYLQEAIKDLGFEAFTDIQQAILPKALEKRDVIGVSETGSGKSHAFLLPVFDHLDEHALHIQALIIAPTRELALQIEKMAKHLASFSPLPIDIRSYSGGKDRLREIERLHKSQPHIAIGTPGKLYDLAIKENALKIYKANTLIIDEADMCLDQGFLPTLEALINTTDQKAQLMLFSATMPKPLRDFVKKSMSHPHEAIFEQRRLENLPIQHFFLRASFDKEYLALDKLLEVLNPYLSLVFANTKEMVIDIYERMKTAGYKVTMMHGGLTARQRKQVLRDIEKLNVQYVVASDMASRGIDIEGISHIINVGLPRDMSFYIHRSGRTGRMGKSGDVYTIYTDKHHQQFKALMKENIKLNFIDVKNKEITIKQKDQKMLKEMPKKKNPKPASKTKVKPGYKKKHHQKMQKRKQR